MERNLQSFPLLAAFMVPHPPMIVPQIGRGSEAQIAETAAAYRQVAREIAALRPETVIISSPHSVMYADYFHISPGKRASGSFAAFRARDVSFHETYDSQLVGCICEAAEEMGLPAGTLGERDPALDHGTMVPLYFLEQEYHGFQIVRIGLSGLPLADHYRLGMAVRSAVEETGRRTVWIASGDLSHKLQDYGPYGFAPEGPQYDDRIMDVCGRAAFGELLRFDEHFCEKAAECGHRSFVMMTGAFDGEAVRAQVLSHQDVTGVGYGICTFYPEGKDEKRHFLQQYLEEEEQKMREARLREDAYVSLARSSIEAYVRQKKRISVPDLAAEEMIHQRAGVFVSLHEHQQLRGCIGTIRPMAASIAQEIIDNAISACSHDPRFEPVREEELDYLEISVDVLTQPEPITGPEELDVKRYGVIVTSGKKRGLLLPDLDGVDSVETQIAIARQKAGIRDGEPVSLERFEVIRHH